MRDPKIESLRAYEASEANYQEAWDEAVDRLYTEIEEKVEELQDELKQELAITELDSHVLDTLKIYFRLD